MLWWYCTWPSIVLLPTIRWCPMFFSSPFPMSWCFTVFFSVHVSLDFFRVLFFTTKVSICIPSPDPLFLTVGDFQAWDWLWYPLTCDPRGRVGVHIEKKSQSKFLPWLGFTPWTSRLAVEHTTARPPCTPTRYSEKKRGKIWAEKMSNFAQRTCLWCLVVTVD